MKWCFRVLKIRCLDVCCWYRAGDLSFVVISCNAPSTRSLTMRSIFFISTLMLLMHTRYAFPLTIFSASFVDTSAHSHIGNSNINIRYFYSCFYAERNRTIFFIRKWFWSLNTPWQRILLLLLLFSLWYYLIELEIAICLYFGWFCYSCVNVGFSVVYSFLVVEFIWISSEAFLIFMSLCYSLLLENQLLTSVRCCAFVLYTICLRFKCFVDWLWLSDNLKNQPSLALSNFEIRRKKVRIK